MMMNNNNNTNWLDKKNISVGQDSVIQKEKSMSASFQKSGAHMNMNASFDQSFAADKSSFINQRYPEVHSTIQYPNANHSLASNQPGQHNPNSTLPIMKSSGRPEDIQFYCQEKFKFQWLNETKEIVLKKASQDFVVSFLLKNTSEKTWPKGINFQLKLSNGSVLNSELSRDVKENEEVRIEFDLKGYQEVDGSKESVVMEVKHTDFTSNIKYFSQKCKPKIIFV